MESEGDVTHASDAEKESRLGLVRLLKSAPIPEEQLLSNLGLFLESKNLARILLMDHLFRQIVDECGRRGARGPPQAPPHRRRPRHRSSRHLVDQQNERVRGEVHRLALAAARRRRSRGVDPLSPRAGRGQLR